MVEVQGMYEAEGRSLGFCLAWLGLRVGTRLEISGEVYPPRSGAGFSAGQEASDWRLA